MRNKVYVSLPITGLKIAEVKARAIRIKQKLIQAEFIVKTPFDVVPFEISAKINQLEVIQEETGKSYSKELDLLWLDAMKYCLDEVAASKFIYLHTGFEKSYGCKIELLTALKFKLNILRPEQLQSTKGIDLLNYETKNYDKYETIY